MKLFLTEEIKIENVLRFQLLREREIKCADGHGMFCDIFKEGYFDSAELVQYTGENNKNNRRNNEKFHTIEDNTNTGKESESGMLRVKSVICDSIHLLPDENSHVFEHLGEYMNFLQSSAGPIYFKSSYEKTRKNPYFRQFSETENKSFFYPKFFTAEFFGIVFSPITYGYEMAEYYVKKNTRILYDVFEKNSNSTDTENTEISPEPYSSIVKFYEYVYNTYYEPNKEMMIRNYPQLIDNISIYYKMLIVPDILNSVYTDLEWTIKIMFQTRKLYYGFYYEKLHEKLPCRRHACLLRNGIKTIEEEIIKIDKKLNDELELQKLENNENINNGNNKSKRKEKKLARDKRREDELDDQNSNIDSNLTFENVDFGPLNSWEASKGVCIQGMFGEYDYQFCFFDRFKQGKTLLGTFINWGTFPLQNDKNNKKDKNKKSRSIKKEKIISKISDNSKNSTVENQSSKFSYQMYGNGLTCQGN